MAKDEFLVRVWGTGERREEETCQEGQLVDSQEASKNIWLCLAGSDTGFFRA
jgi:hypothetical protein